MADANNTSNKDNKKAEATTDAAQRHADNAAQKLDAKLSGPLAPLENALDGIFGEKSSIQLPKNIKDFLVKVAPWLALLSGVFGLWSAYTLWRWAHRANDIVDGLNDLYGINMRTSTVELGLWFWLSIIMMVVFAVLALLAFPGLKAKKKIGWNLMFYSLVASVAYGVVSLFYDGTGSLLGAVVSAIIGAFILFQIRSHYKA